MIALPGRGLRLAAALLAVAGCNESPAAPAGGVSLEITAGNGQRAPAGSAVAVNPTVSLVDGSGDPVEGVGIAFSVVTGGGWTAGDAVTTDAAGRASAWWLLGPDPGEPQRLRARAGSATAEFTATATAPVPGTTLTGRAGYIEYIAGDLPVIIGAPHGGSLTPAEIPDRTWGTLARDTNTEELIRAMREAFLARTGGAPHVVINRLHRVKLDANREILEAAQGNAHAERAWFEWQAFIEAAKVAASAERPGSQALYFDLHGQSHPIQRIEIGYLLGAGDLGLDDAALAQPAMIQKSSIRTLAGEDGSRFLELIRGDTGLGELLERAGYPSVPSARQPAPGSDPYYSGGYNTARHGSRDGGTVSGIQLELNFAGVRDTEGNRERFAAAFADMLVYYFETHLGVGLAAMSLQ